jgi:hypothetical protein
MFRITTRTTTHELLMRLEGELVGPWVSELDTCWRDAVSKLDGQRVHVDVTAVCRVDAEGRELMRRMYLAGAAFEARGCVMPEVLREIADTAGAVQTTVQGG